MPTILLAAAFVSFLPVVHGPAQQGHQSVLGKFFHSLQNIKQPSPLVSVDVSMKKIAALSKLADMKKKDARLTIRIPRELKAKIEGIDRIYGVALPKIANECLKAFCEYVEQKKQTPTFPLSVSPHLPSGEKSSRERQGLRSRQPRRT
jgi:hypothetical protein